MLYLLRFFYITHPNHTQTMEDTNLFASLTNHQQQTCTLCGRNSLRPCFVEQWWCSKCKNAFYNGFTNMNKFINISKSDLNEKQKASKIYDYFTMKIPCKVNRFNLEKAENDIFVACSNFCVNCRFRLWLRKITEPDLLKTFKKSPYGAGGDKDYNTTCGHQNDMLKSVLKLVVERVTSRIKKKTSNDKSSQSPRATSPESRNINSGKLINFIAEDELQMIHQDLEEMTLGLQNFQISPLSATAKKSHFYGVGLPSYKNLNDEFTGGYIMNIMRLQITDDNCLDTPDLFKRNSIMGLSNTEIVANTERKDYSGKFYSQLIQSAIFLNTDKFTLKTKSSSNDIYVDSNGMFLNNILKQWMKIKNKRIIDIISQSWLNICNNEKNYVFKKLTESNQAVVENFVGMLTNRFSDVSLLFELICSYNSKDHTYFFMPNLKFKRDEKSVDGIFSALFGSKGKYFHEVINKVSESLGTGTFLEKDKFQKLDFIRHKGLLEIIELRILLIFSDILISDERYPNFMKGVLITLKRNLNGIIKKYNLEIIVKKLVYVIGSFIRIDKMLHENTSSDQTFSYFDF